MSDDKNQAKIDKAVTTANKESTKAFKAKVKAATDAVKADEGASKEAKKYALGVLKTLA